MSDSPLPGALPAAEPQIPLKKKNHAWLWFYAFLVVASFGVAWLMIWFNLSIQLTPVQLEAARKLWQEKGPRDYKMTYSTRINDLKSSDQFIVTVRGGKVLEVSLNGNPLEAEQRPYHSMDRLFNNLERFMELDGKPGQPKVFVTAIFDDKTGALRKYIRRVMGKTERVEIHASIEELPR